MSTSYSASNLTALAETVEHIVARTPVVDIHTHLYDPSFSDLLLWGIDDLLVYHYLVAEMFRQVTLPFHEFWAFSKVEQANLVWHELFVQHSPVSEACRGVLTTLQALGLDVRKRDLPAIRRWFSQRRLEPYLTRCLELAKVSSITMTNSPFDDVERPVWERGFPRDDRFTAALRIDPLLLSWNQAAPRLRSWGYEAEDCRSPKTTSEVRRFLAEWTQRIQARYLMVSLPPDFEYPASTATNHFLEQAVLPHCREFGLPLALMIGVKRGVNPELRMAGDASGLSRMAALEQLCASYPENKFMATVLARENQHELCVVARKFRNLHIFGCWWFTNIPHVVQEMTRMRLELLGLSFTPQHSDARVLDQLIYKWDHFRKILGQVLVEKYLDLARTGWLVSAPEIERDVAWLMGGSFQRFCSAKT